MTTKNDIQEELKQWLKDKLEECTIEQDEEAMQWQEDADQHESEFYEVASYELNKILKDFQNISEFLENVENFVNNL